MKIEPIFFDSGWIGLTLGLTEVEINELVSKLISLKDDKVNHFHIRANTFEGNRNVADIEFYKANLTCTDYSVE